MVDFDRVPNSGKRTVQFAISSGSARDLIYMPNRAEVEVWDIFTGEHVNRLQGHYSQVNGCIFHQDYQELYSAGSDRNILVWEPDMNMKSQEIIKTKVNTKESQKEVTTTDKVTAALADSWSSDEETWKCFLCWYGIVASLPKALCVSSLMSDSRYGDTEIQRNLVKVVVGAVFLRRYQVEVLKYLLLVRIIKTKEHANGLKGR